MTVQVLLVEDSPTDRLLTVSALQDAGFVHDLHWVEDGAQALAFLRQEPPYVDMPRPDLVLLDLNLPGVDGRTVLEQVKKDRDLCGIPVVVLTTSGAQDDIAAAYRSHANSYIEKPIDFQRFEHAIQALESYWFKVVTLPDLTDTEPASLPDSSGSDFRSTDQTEYDVLLIEDNHEDHQLFEQSLRAGLRHHSVRLRWAKTVSAVPQLIKDSPPTVVVTDLSLPGNDGLESITAVRALCPEAALIVLTGSRNADAGRPAIRAGADDYLHKDELLPTTIRRVIDHAVERRAMQRELHAAIKHRRVAQLAGSVAHDFNNLLTIIEANVHAMRDDGYDDTLAQGILDAAGRGARLTRQLMAQGRRQPLRPRPTDMVGFFAHREGLLSRLAGPTIQVRIAVEPDVARPLADPDALELMVFNLVSNAVDAMSAGGEIQIQVRPQGDDDVAITVRDQGNGIPANVLPHIFDAFYTTKPRATGSGLGLSSALETARQHGGDLRIQTTRGVGTAATIILPASHASRAASIPPGERPIRTGRNECVLVIDDQEAVRRAVARNLEMAGYRTVAAGNGAAARQIAAEGQIDIVLCDLMLGNEDGREVAAALVADGMTAPIVFMSGYPEAFSGDVDALRPGVNFIQKPFRPAALSNLVRSALDRSLHTTGETS